MGLLGELRDRWRHRRDPYPCREAVELVTQYLEGAMTPLDAERFERHLLTCGPCTRYVEQVRRTADTLGRVHPPAPPNDTQEALLHAFREFHRR